MVQKLILYLSFLIRNIYCLIIKDYKGRFIDEDLSLVDDENQAADITFQRHKNKQKNEINDEIVGLLKISNGKLFYKYHDGTIISKSKEDMIESIDAKNGDIYNYLFNPVKVSLLNYIFKIGSKCINSMDFKKLQLGSCDSESALFMMVGRKEKSEKSEGEKDNELKANLQEPKEDKEQNNSPDEKIEEVEGENGNDFMDKINQFKIKLQEQNSEANNTENTLLEKIYTGPNKASYFMNSLNPNYDEALFRTSISNLLTNLNTNYSQVYSLNPVITPVINPAINPAIIPVNKMEIENALLNFIKQIETNPKIAEDLMNSSPAQLQYLSFLINYLLSLKNEANANNQKKKDEEMAQLLFLSLLNRDSETDSIIDNYLLQSSLSNNEIRNALPLLILKNPERRKNKRRKELIELLNKRDDEIRDIKNEQNRAFVNDQIEMKYYIKKLKEMIRKKEIEKAIKKNEKKKEKEKKKKKKKSGGKGGGGLFGGLGKLAGGVAKMTPHGAALNTALDMASNLGKKEDSNDDSE